ncbi:MAG: hypothetical protein NTY36_05645, partial [Deltaproteobacteria bacterium]|nr:hypothetical protein [Deltaproteobacteria bacterium]
MNKKDSYCGLCNTCPLGNLDFLEALAKVKNYVSHLPLYWWAHCFPGNEGFSLPEFFKGLEWFLSQPECPGCKEGGAFEVLPKNETVIMRGLESRRDLHAAVSVYGGRDHPDHCGVGVAD